LQVVVLPESVFLEDYLPRGIVLDPFAHIEEDRDAVFVEKLGGEGAGIASPLF